MKRLAISILGALLVYVFGAFVAWEANPGEWSEPGRFMCALIASSLAAAPWAYRLISGPEEAA